MSGLIKRIAILIYHRQTAGRRRLIQRKRLLIKETWIKNSRLYGINSTSRQKEETQKNTAIKKRLDHGLLLSLYLQQSTTPRLRLIHRIERDFVLPALKSKI